MSLWMNDGSLVIDSQGRLVNCADCPCDVGNMVLLWDSNDNATMAGMTQAKTVYTNNGITAHLSSEWTGNLDDYFLIIWLMAESDPVWWSEISGGTWSGRFHISAEWFQFPATRNYVNSKNSLHGVTVNNDITPGPYGCLAGGPQEIGNPAAHALTAGVTALRHSAAASVTGGNTLFTNSVSSAVIVVQNKPANIDWVVSGEATHIADNCATAAPANSQFLLNLSNVPLP